VNEPSPSNPFGEIAQLATTVHEVFVSYVEAGFTVVSDIHGHGMPAQSLGD
jgi:hypothetical protein